MGRGVCATRGAGGDQVNGDMQTVLACLDGVLAQKQREGALTPEQANGIYVSTYNRVCAHLDDVAAQAQAQAQVGGMDAPTDATPVREEPAAVAASSVALIG